MPTLSLITTLNYLKSGACLKLLSKQGGKKRWWIGLKIREGVGLRLIAQPDYARTRPYRSKTFGRSRRRIYRDKKGPSLTLEKERAMHHLRD